MEFSTDRPAEPTGDGLTLAGGGSAGSATTSGSVYQSGKKLLTPVEIRWQRFPMTRFGRRGLDPEAVGNFLRRVEADLDVLYQEVVAARDEACLYRDTVLEMQAEGWRQRQPGAPRRRGEYRRAPMWPPYSPHRQGGHRRPAGRPDDD